MRTESVEDPGGIADRGSSPSAAPGGARRSPRPRLAVLCAVPPLRLTCTHERLCAEEDEGADDVRGPRDGSARACLCGKAAGGQQGGRAKLEVQYLDEHERLNQLDDRLKPTPSIGTDDGGRTAR